MYIKQVIINMIIIHVIMHIIRPTFSISYELCVNDFNSITLYTMYFQQYGLSFKKYHNHCCVT